MIRLRWLWLGTLFCVFPACGDDRVIVIEREAAPASTEPADAAVSPVEPGGTGGSTAASQASCAGNERSCGQQPPPAGSSGGGGGDEAGGAGGAGGGGSDSAGSSGSGGAPANGTLLPDLVLDGAYLRDTTTQDFVDVTDACLVAQRCTTGTGRRRVVRFGTRTGNLGTADLVMGKPGASNPYWSFDSCHMNYQLADYARYELIDTVNGSIVLVGGKSGFCMRDSEPWNVDDTSMTCASYDCDAQGISRRCADNYGSALQCQWVDITSIPAGVYDLRVTINASHNIQELDYANDVVTVRIRIGDADVAVVQ